MNYKLASFKKAGVIRVGKYNGLSIYGHINYLLLINRGERTNYSTTLATVFFV